VSRHAAALGGTAATATDAAAQVVTFNTPITVVSCEC
jgi:hypothetical protein